MQHKLFTILLSIVGLLAVGLGGFFIGRSLNSRNTTNTNNQNSVSTTNRQSNTNVNLINTETNLNASTNTNEVQNTNQATNSDYTGVEPIVDTGVEWLDEPVALADLELFKEYYDFTPEYYQIATLSDGKILAYAKLTYQGPADPQVARFKQVGGTRYTLLTQHSTTQSNILDQLVEEVEIDETTAYAALDYPGFLEVSGLELQQTWAGFSYNQLFNQIEEAEGNVRTYFGTTAYGDVYESVSPVRDDDTTLKGKKYLLKLADTSTVIYFDHKPFLADDGTLIAELNQVGDSHLGGKTFANGLISEGCGYPIGDQFYEFGEDELVEIGTTKTGDLLYTLQPGVDHVLFRDAYETYKVGRDYPDSPIALIAYDDFLNQYPLVIWQDGAGDYIVFMDTNFTALAECGKPVIYLYPTSRTSVSVQVAADVTLSEPTYGNGWKVIAQPDGRLTLPDGKTIGSLYWEGKGHGLYPKITQGKVVPTNQIEQVLRQDLAQLGLNNQETQDFLAFWLPKMPETLYVRLTWLDTPAMDQLAPLTVSPKPDTVIRVFLDFAGQDTQETTLLPQTLRAKPRLGFTVVEWGGLLIGTK